MVPIDVKEQDFMKLMNIYQKATEQIVKELNFLKEELREVYGHDVINNITSRIKSPESIIKKMKKKQYQLNYKNLIKYINDIAGIRITCPFKRDIKHVIKAIKNIEGVIIVKEKDYITNPKRSGYSAYHLIVKVPVDIQGQQFFVKAEIQIRTATMDVWSIAEHEIKYKPQKKLSFIDSKRLSIYAKIINIIDTKIMKLYEKQVKSI